MKRGLVISGIVCLFTAFAAAQNAPDLNGKLQKAIEQRQYSAVVTELQNLKQSDRKLFELNNYDYLLGRMSEKTGDFAAAIAEFQKVANRNSPLKEYALLHIAQVAHTTGNLLLERINLQQLLESSPESLLAGAAHNSLARNAFEARNFAETIRLLNAAPPPVG